MSKQHGPGVYIRRIDSSGFLYRHYRHRIPSHPAAAFPAQTGDILCLRCVSHIGVDTVWHCAMWMLKCANNAYDLGSLSSFVFL